MKTAGDFIALSAEFAARVKDGIYHLRRRDTLRRMYTGGDTAPVILYRNAVAGVYRYLYQVAVTGKRLVYRVIHYFIDKMVQSAHRSCTDVHSGALADSLKSLKHLYLAFGVCLVRYNGIKHLILRVKRRFCGFNVELSHVFRNLCGFCRLI